MLEPAGRQRDRDVTRAVQAAALQLAYSNGIAYATVERISQLSSVAKSTIYRRWPNASAIVLEAFSEEVEPFIQYNEKSSIERTMCETVNLLLTTLSGKRGELLRQVLGLAQSDPNLKEVFIASWIAPRRQLGEAVLKKAIARGELHSDTDVGQILDLIYGAIYYNLAVNFNSLDAAYVERLVGRVFHGLIERRS